MQKIQKLLSVLLAVIMLFGITADFSIQSFAQGEAPGSVVAEKSDSQYMIGLKKGLTVYCKYCIAGFTVADLSSGRIMKPSESDYKMNEDKTVLTLKPSYLDGLKAGEYIVSVFYDTEDDGYIDQHTFRIVEPERETTTQTTTVTSTKPTAENSSATTVSSRSEVNTETTTKSPATGYNYFSEFAFVIVIAVCFGLTAYRMSLKKKCEE
ncbi:MAG: hypothetical protein K1V95_07420 [Eubacterium sp.]